MVRRIDSAHEKTATQGKEAYPKTKEIQDHALHARESLEGS
jgi:hypothetical protein